MAIPLLNKFLTEEVTTQECLDNPAFNTDMEIMVEEEDILALLNKIYKNHTMLTVSMDDANGTFGSAILEINQNESYLVLDELWPEPGHQLVEVGKTLFISAQLAGVYAHFTVNISAIGEHEEAAYYKASLPRQIDYQQRRSNYRVPTSINKPIPVNMATEEDVLINAELRDISIGGFCARLISPSNHPLELGEYIPTCLIKSPNGRKILSSIAICRIEDNKKTGLTRIGAQFSVLGKTDKRELEHLIATLDRNIIRRLKRQ